MSKQIVLCDLRHNDRIMTTWLEAVPGLVYGAQITLKDYGDPTTLWTVERVYQGEAHYTEDFDFHRKWDNNNYDKHKGLGV